MTRTLIASIEKTCPACGTANRILTTEIRPRWTINCSHCGDTIVERRAFRSCIVREGIPDCDLPADAG